MFIYLINAINTNLYKIGYTRNIKSRLKQLQTGSAQELQLIDFWETKWGKKIEFTLHRTFSSYKVHGEWFEFTEIDDINFNKTCEQIENNFNILKANGNMYI